MLNPNDRLWVDCLNEGFADIQVRHQTFGICHDSASSELMRVTKYRRKTVFIESMQAFHERKQALREAIASADLNDEEMTLIDAAEIPEEHRYNIED